MNDIGERSILRPPGWKFKDGRTGVVRDREVECSDMAYAVARQIRRENLKGCGFRLECQDASGGADQTGQLE
jgi:hypothetical protein